MITFGLDHGTKSGYAIMNTKTNEVTIGRFVVEGTTDGSKFKDFKKKVESLIEQYKPDVICTERPMDKINGRTTTYLIGLYSTIHLIAFEHQIDIEEMYPTSVKKSITGNGNADKIEVARVLSKRYNIPLEEIAKPIRYKRTMFNRRLKRVVQSGEIKDYEFDSSDALALCEKYKIEHCNIAGKKVV